MNNEMSGKKKVNFKQYMEGLDHQGKYSPSLFMPNIGSFGCEGEAYYGDMVSDALRKNHNINYKKMKYDDYKNLVEGANNHIENSEDADFEDDDVIVKKYIAGKIKK